MTRLALATALLIAAPAAGERPVGEIVPNPGRHADVATRAAITPDGKTVLTFGSDRAVRVWDAGTGRPTATLWLPRAMVPRWHGAGAVSTWVSPDGRLVTHRTVGTKEEPRYQICLVPLSGPGAYRVVAELAESFDDVTFSPDGRRMAAACRGGTVRVWDVASGRTVMKVAAGPEGWPESVAFTPDGSRVTAVVYSDNRPAVVRTWDVATGRRAGEFEAADTDRAVWVDGQTVAAMSGGRKVQLFRPDGTRVAAFRPRGQSVVGTGFVAGGRFLAAHAVAWPDEPLVVRDETAGAELARIDRPKGVRSWEATFTPDGRRMLAAREYPAEVTVWDLAARREVSRFPTTDTPPPAKLGWSADGAKLAWRLRPVADGDAGFEHALRLADFAPVRVGPGEQFVSVREEQDGMKLTKVEQYTVKVAVAGTETEVSAQVDYDADSVEAATLLPGGRVLIGTFMGLLGEFDVRTGERVRGYRVWEGPAGLVPSADAGLFAAVFEGPVVEVYRRGTQAPVLSVFPAGDEWAAWTPAGYWAASARGGGLAGYVTDPGPNRLWTFTPLSARPARNRPDLLAAALRP